MPVFTYIAKTKDAKTIRDKEEAPSREELTTRLRARGLFIIEVKEFKKEEAKPRLFSRFTSGKHSGLKSYDLAFFARNLSTTLSSGVTLLRSLEIISLQTSSLRLGKALRECSVYVKEGLSLSEAVAKYPQIFSPLWQGVIEVGEASGNLPFVLERLADYLDMRLDFERKVKGALVYPTIILIAGIIAMFVFFNLILPKFAVIFKGFNLELPLITQMLFDITKYMQKNFIFIIVSIIVLILFVARSRKVVATKELWDKVNLKAPLIKDVVFIACLERFTSTMYILLESGLPLVSTLEIAAHSMGNLVLERVILYVKDRVREGGSLSGEFLKSEFLPPLVSEMAKIGEETGAMPEVFKKISLHYRKELTTRVERFIAAFEPLMIILLGIIIGTIVIALFLPLFRIATLGGRGGGSF